MQCPKVQISTRRVDFFIESLIPTEVKVAVNIDSSHLAQALAYFEADNLEIGLMLNFGAPSLQYQRLLNKKYKPPTVREI